MRTVWVVRIITAEMPGGFTLCECHIPEHIGTVVGDLCRAFIGDDDPPRILVTTELRNAPLPIAAQDN